MHLHAGCALNVSEVFNQLLRAPLQILGRVLIVLVGRRDVQAEIRSKILKIVIERQLQEKKKSKKQD